VGPGDSCCCASHASKLLRPSSVDCGPSRRISTPSRASRSSHRYNVVRTWPASTAAFRGCEDPNEDRDIRSPEGGYGLSVQRDRKVRQRHLDWVGCYNTRDLGGLPTIDGGETCWQSVIRSDTLNRLSVDGRKAMLAYGVRSIIDLRAVHEVQRWPSSFAVSDGGVLTYLNLPIEYYYPHVGALLSGAQSRAEAYCIILDHYPDAVVAIMEAIASARPGGVVIHCYSGKDRTGIVTGLLLSLVGVPPSMIAEDYAESQQRLRRYYEQQPVQAGSTSVPSFWLLPTATADDMHRMLTHVATRYGGPDAYLRAAGMVDAQVAQLRGRLSPGRS
jgi:protein-tyrosine phosphatase